MYDNYNIPEPTCEGPWKRQAADGSETVEGVYGPINGGMYWVDWTGGMCACKDDGVTWTGPIPIPEDKPAPSDNELGHCAIQQVRDHLGGNIVGFSYLTDKDREDIGAVIRAKLGGK